MEDYIRILDSRENKWKGIVEDNINNKGSFHALMCEVYVKHKLDLINREYYV